MITYTIIIVIHSILIYFGLFFSGEPIDENLSREARDKILSEQEKEFMGSFPFMTKTSFIVLIGNTFPLTLIFFLVAVNFKLRFDAIFYCLLILFFIFSFLIMVYFTLDDYKKAVSKGKNVSFKEKRGLIVLAYTNSVIISLLITAVIRILIG